jgi:hypothetical protein
VHRDLTRLRWIAALGGALAVCACGSSGPGGVAVDALQTNVVFGAEQQHAVAPAPTPAPAPAALPPALAAAEQTFAVPASFYAPMVSPVFAPFAGLCGTASPNSFPAEPATAGVTRMPDAGAWRWVASGTHDVTTAGITIQFPVIPSFQNVVRNVQTFADSFPQTSGGSSGPDFTYDSIVPQLGATTVGYWQFVWQVKANAATADPEDGLSLIEVDAFDAQGSGETTIFKAAPHNGLLLLPLPAAPGPVAPQAVTSTQGLPVPVSPPASSTQSIDTSGSGNSMQFNGSVGSPEKVDACGTWLQAWPVDGTLVSGTGTATIHLDVATQFGALPIAFNIDGTFLGATFHKETAHVAQTPPPSAVPKQWQ